MKKRERLRIAVVGGGASGMMAAVCAAKQGARVDLYEKNERVGKKLLATGNGKCNFSNRNLSADSYYGSEPEKRQALLEQFPVLRTMDFFSKAGMLIKEKNGYLYPWSEQASTVLDVLRRLLAEQQVTLYTECPVTRVERLHRERPAFRLFTEKKQQDYDRVILACGGMAAPKTGSDGSGYRLAKQLGHTIIPTVPALVQLRCQEPFLKTVAGVREDAVLTLCADGTPIGRERGELQLTDYGISGIVTFQLSRLAAYALQQGKQVTVQINSMPQMTEQEYDSFAEKRLRWGRESGCTAEAFFTGMLNKKLMQLFCRLGDVKWTEEVKKQDPRKLQRVFALCRRLEVTVQDTNSFDQAQVTAGGIPLAEVTEGLESVLAPGLYLAGELLDVDGKCGGYNLQWAWTSGYLAGFHAGAQTEEAEE